MFCYYIVGMYSSTHTAATTESSQIQSQTLKFSLVAYMPLDTLILTCFACYSVLHTQRHRYNFKCSSFQLYFNVHDLFCQMCAKFQHQ